MQNCARGACTCNLNNLPFGTLLTIWVSVHRDPTKTEQTIHLRVVLCIGIAERPQQHWPIKETPKQSFGTFENNICDKRWYTILATSQNQISDFGKVLSGVSISLEVGKHMYIDYHSQTIGPAVRFKSTLILGLQQYVSEHKLVWDGYLSLWTYTHNVKQQIYMEVPLWIGVYACYHWAGHDRTETHIFIIGWRYNLQHVWEPEANKACYGSPTISSQEFNNNTTALRMTRA